MRWLMLAGAVLAVAAPIPALAQTPAVGAPATTCAVAPRPIDATLAFWFSPNATPVATPIPATPLASAAELPAGQPIDADTQAAVEATLREVVACGNAGDFARRLALFTDRLARQLGPPPGVTAEDARAALATPQPVPPTQAATIVAFGAGQRLADGRVALTMTLDDPTARPRRQQLDAILAPAAGGWLVDDLVPIASPATPIATPSGPATPAGGG